MPISKAAQTRDHITAALTVNATGEMAPTCCFLWGVRNIATKHLASLSKAGYLGHGAYDPLQMASNLATPFSSFFRTLLDM